MEIIRVGYGGECCGISEEATMVTSMVTSHCSLFLEWINAIIVHSNENERTDHAKHMLTG